MKKNKSKNKPNKIEMLTVSNFRILIGLIVVLLVIILFKFFILEQTYTSRDFSVRYPRKWLVQKDANSSFARSINLTGKEGTVQVVVGQGINSNCDPESRIILKTFNGELLMCSMNNETGLTLWGSVKNLQNLTFSVIAHINPPVNENRNIILNIISSLKR